MSPTVRPIRQQRCLISLRTSTTKLCSMAWWKNAQHFWRHVCYDQTQRHKQTKIHAVNPSGEGSATWVLLLHSAGSPVSSTMSHKSSMLYLTTSVHLFLCLPRLRCPWTSASRIRLTQSSSSLRCISPYHLSQSINQSNQAVERMPAFAHTAKDTLTDDTVNQKHDASANIRPSTV